MPSPTRAKFRPTSDRLASATAILVLGMHRSGTSAIARVLNLRGAELGRDLLPAKEDNERGFWENRAILELHETLLNALGLRWLDLADLPEGWQRTAPARRFVADLPDVLKQEFEGHGLFTVKDPRLSLLAPLWIEALTAAGVRPTFVVTIRHPHEVAASLARRDGLPAAQSQLLWLQHLVDAERATRGQARVFVHYERLLADWSAELARVGEQLAIEWPPAPADFDAAVTQFLAPALRHHHAGNDADAALLPIVAQAYAQASTAALGPEPAALFDHIDGGVEVLLRTVAPLYRELAARHDAERHAHAGEIERARASFAAKQDEIERAREAFSAKEDEIARAREASAIREAEIETARRSIESLSEELDQARGVIKDKDQEIAAARVNIDTLTTELGLARDNIHALAGEITLAREAFADKEREIDAARSNIEALAADLERARDAHAAKERELDAQRGAFAAKEREVDAARINIDSLAADIERARAGFAAKDAEIDAARRNIDALVAEIDGARQAHAVRDATETALRGELQALRQSRWFRLGRSLRLIDGRDA